MKVINKAEIGEDGKVAKIWSQASFNEGLKRFAGRTVKITVELYRKPKTPPQCALFHIWCDIISDETGNSAEVVKSLMKTKYGQYPLLDENGDEQFDKSTGEKLMYVKDIKDMNVEEMAWLMQNTQQFALEFAGIILKSINEQNELSFQNK